MNKNMIWKIAVMEISKMGEQRMIKFLQRRRLYSKLANRLLISVHKSVGETRK